MTVVIAIAAAMTVFLDIDSKSVNLPNEARSLITSLSMRIIINLYVVPLFPLIFLFYIISLKDIVKY